MKKFLLGIALLLSQNAMAEGAMPLEKLTLLVLGESHMVSMGQSRQLIGALPDELARLGARVYTYGACSGSADGWMKTRAVQCSAFRINGGPIRYRPSDIASTQPVAELIKKHQPNAIVLVIGDTMASYDTKTIPKQWVQQGVSSLTKEIKAHNIRCIWVGPTWGDNGGTNRYQKNNRRVQDFSEYLSTLVEPCTYIDSRNFSKIGEWKTIDGQHFDDEGYRAWAKNISHAIISPEILKTIKP